MCKFHDPSIIGSRDTEGGSEGGGGGGGGGGRWPPPPPPPVTDCPEKPSLNRVNAIVIFFSDSFFEFYFILFYFFISFFL